MCFLENNVRYRLAAILGVAAFVVPEQAPWTLLATLLSVVTAIGCTSGRGRLVALLVAGSLFVGVAGGFLSASFVTAILAAVTLGRFNRLLALAVLALQVSYASSFEALTGNFLFGWHLEAAAPALLSGLLLFIIQPQRTWWRAVLALLPLPVVWSAQRLGIGPYGLLLVSGIPSMALAGMTPRDERLALDGLTRIAVAGVLALGAIGWAMTPPKLPEVGYVVLPGEMKSPEGKFYRNYQEVLRFAGIPAKVVESIEDIPPASLVLWPWLTAAEQREGAPTYERLRELALERGWLVMMVGEHTDMGGVATRVKTITGQPFLRNDLSVPLGNTDDSGQMRGADIRVWYPEAMLNRGASVEVRSPLNRVLLSGDGWWAEPDIGEWLWVGDYLWQPQDRHGRLVMAMTADEGRARWVMLGDTGPFINQQLVSDPRPAARLLELATLRPLFVRDIGLAIVTVAVALGLPFVLQLATVGLVVLAALLPLRSNEGSWRSLWRQESAFDERNFNLALVESRALLTTDWKLVKPKAPLGPQLSLPATPTIIFGLVDDTLTMGNTKLSNCKRLGALSADGVFLMDAQACKAEGKVEVLVGDMDEAAIVKVENLILILDQNFLGQKAPSINRDWLEKTVKSAK